MLAISLDRQGRNDEGAVQFEKALALAQQWVAREPENGEAQVLLARIYQQGGNLSEAVATLLNRPVAEQTATPEIVERLQRRLEDYLRAHTEVLLD